MTNAELVLRQTEIHPHLTRRCAVVSGRDRFWRDSRRAISWRSRGTPRFRRFFGKAISSSKTAQPGNWRQLERSFEASARL